MQNRDTPTARRRMRSFRPGVRPPDTLLVAKMHDGSLLLQGWADGPGAYLTAEDARPLLRELDAAFGVAPPPPQIAAPASAQDR